MSELNAGVDTLFLDARSHNGWTQQTVGDNDLATAWDCAKLGPTSMNTQPLRMLFLRTPEAKERLKPALAPSNVSEVMTAPIVAVMAYDLASIRN